MPTLTTPVQGLGRPAKDRPWRISRRPRHCDGQPSHRLIMKKSTRRDFLYIASAIVAAVGAAAALVPLVARMVPTLRRSPPAARSISTLARSRKATRSSFAGGSGRSSCYHRTKQTLDDAVEGDDRTIGRPEFGADAAAALCRPIGTARSSPNSASWSASAPISLHPAVLSGPERQRAGGQLARRLFLPVPRLEIDPAGRVYLGMPAPYNLPVPPIASSTPRRCASARMVASARRPGTSTRSASFEAASAKVLSRRHQP